MRATTTVATIATAVAIDASRSRRRSSSVRWRRAGFVRSATASVTRSSAIAITTITRPARSARAGYELRPLVTTSPRPLPPISPAITTIESANRIVWLTERSSIRRASGSRTLKSSWRRVEPIDSAASTVFARNAADPEGRDPDRRRDRVDHRRDHRRARDRPRRGSRSASGTRTPARSASRRARG